MTTRPLRCAAAALLLAASRAEALPDPSCTKLLGDLYAYLATPVSTVAVLHMSNYQANGQWWGGYTRAELSRGWSSSKAGTVDVNRVRLVGSGIRLSSASRKPIEAPNGGFRSESTQPFWEGKPEAMSYEITMAGQITFGGKYGPYEMTCMGDKFAIVNGYDSFETFSFVKGRKSAPPG
jgi:hypothetical protein